MVIHRLEHSFDLMELSLLKCEQNMGFIDSLNSHGPGRLLFPDFHACLQQIGFFPGQPMFYGHHICFIHMSSGCQKSVGQRTVIGEQQKSFRILIQTACGKNVRPLIFSQKLYHGFVPVVCSGGNDSLGLVQHVIYIFSINQRASLQADQIPILTDSGFG